MSYERVLYAAAAATSATKVPFELGPSDFQGSTPQLQISGTLAAGDDVFLWSWLMASIRTLGRYLMRPSSRMIYQRWVNTHSPSFSLQ